VVRDALKMELYHDRVCFNRESVIRQTLSRVRIESGDLKKGEAELKKAIALSRDYLKKVRRASQMKDIDCKDPAAAPAPK